MLAAGALAQPESEHVHYRRLEVAAPWGTQRVLVTFPRRSDRLEHPPGERYPILVAIHGRGESTDPERGYPQEWQERLIDLCVAADVSIEVNESYGVPHREFLERALRRGARFAVGSDTHFELRPLDRTMEMIRAAGLAADRFVSPAPARPR